MSQESLTLRQAAQLVNLDENELRHAAQRGEVPAQERGGDWHFVRRDLDEWAQRDLLAASPREQLRRHAAIRAARQRAHDGDARIADLFRPGSVTLSLGAKAKAGVVRDMADLAARTGLVYDPEALYRELKAREDVASTAVGEGAAFLHPRFHDPYLFEESFVCYGRSLQPVFFGAADGEATHHFFLVCATDDAQHLRILSRLAVMAHATEFLSLLDEAEDAEKVEQIVRAAEEGLLK